MGRTDASQKKSHSQEGGWSEARLNTVRRKTRTDSFHAEEWELISVSYLPSGNPSSRLGPGALTDRETKTPQPRCSAPPPAPLKGPAATRPSGHLHRLRGGLNHLKRLFICLQGSVTARGATRKRSFQEMQTPPSTFNGFKCHLRSLYGHEDPLRRNLSGLQ